MMTTLLARLRKDERGVAFVEFALALPVLLTLILGGIELANFILAHQQVSRLASIAADNASRYRSSIGEADVRKLMLGSRLASSGLDLESRGRLILSSVTENARKDGYRIRWQRCEGNLDVDSEFGAQEIPSSPQRLESIDGMLIAPGTNVMFAEAVYDYEPLFINHWVGTMRIRYQASSIARELVNYDIMASPGETPKTC